jgi:hypothetical protein
MASSLVVVGQRIRENISLQQKNKGNLNIQNIQIYYYCIACYIWPETKLQETREK